jgi:integrase
LGQYRSVLGRVERDAGPLLELDDRDLAGWLERVAVSTASRSTYRAALASFYRWARTRGLVAASPVELVASPRLPRRHPRPVSVEQFRAILAASSGEVRAWVLLAGLAGLRRAEVTYLEAGDIDRAAGVLELRHGTKGGHERRVGLHPVLSAELDRWPVEVGRMWPRHPSTVGDRVGRAMAAAGVPGTMHALRHYFATELYRASGDLRLVQSALGHASPATTAGYVAVVADMRPAVAAIPA